jgi:diguanylate cyclase (GGDEF)-like protein/PAS domain S-box-containing protein
MIKNTLSASRSTDAFDGDSAAATRLRQGVIPAPGHDRPLGGVSKAAILKALDMVGEAVFFLDADLRIADANSVAARDSGYRRAELRGLRLQDVLADDAEGRLRAAAERTLRGEFQDEMLPAQMLAKDSRSTTVHVQFRLIDREAEPMIVMLMQQIGGKRRLGQRLLRARDYLTALPAREALERRLRRAERRARQTKGGLAVLFIDLDDFKRVNDSQGHRAGDRLLKALSQRLLESVRPGDFVARYGGDEFVVLIEDVPSAEEVERIAQRIRDNLKAPVLLGESSFEISASVGVAIGQSSAEELFDEADRAMYRAKGKCVERRQWIGPC